MIVVSILTIRMEKFFHESLSVSPRTTTFLAGCVRCARDRTGRSVFSSAKSSTTLSSPVIHGPGRRAGTGCGDGSCFQQDEMMAIHRCNNTLLKNKKKLASPALFSNKISLMLIRFSEAPMLARLLLLRGKCRSGC